jgi:hypothetical protein
VDSTTVKTWLEGLGQQAASRAGATGEEVYFGPAGSPEQRGVIRWRTPTLMDVYDVQRVPAAALATQWRDPSNTLTPGAVLRDAVGYVARSFPLVEGGVSDENDGAVVYFSAPLFDEPLTRQSFAITVSAVLRAAATFEAGWNVRAAQLAALAELQTAPVGHGQEYTAPAAPPTSATAPPAAPVPPAPASPPTWQAGNDGRG